MNKLLLALQVIVTLALGLFGLQKVVMPIADLLAQGMLWIEDFPEWQVRTIGAIEFVGVVGLNVPHFIKKLPMILSPLAALGLGLTMIGAIATHVVRRDPAPSIIITSLLFLMCLVVAHKRFQFVKAQRFTAEG